jgi:hypothetical protein
MMSAQRIAVKALLFCLAALPCSKAIAQEQAPGVYRTPEEIKAKETTEIDSGWVVAYGALLTKPYRVEFRDDTIRINDVPYEPTQNPKIDSTIFMHDLKYEISQALTKTYKEEYKLHGREAAEKTVLERFKPDSIISKIEFDSVDGNATVTWWDGQTEYYYLDSWLEAYPDNQEIRMRVKVSTSSELSAGGMVAFGDGYHLNLPLSKGKQVFDILEEIKTGKISVYFGKVKLMTIAHEAFANDIVKNIDKW